MYGWCPQQNARGHQWHPWRNILSLTAVCLAPEAGVLKTDFYRRLDCASVKKCFCGRLHTGFRGVPVKDSKAADQQPELETKEFQSLHNMVWRRYLLSLHRVTRTLKFYSSELRIPTCAGTGLNWLIFKNQPLRLEADRARDSHLPSLLVRRPLSMRLKL